MESCKIKTLQMTGNGVKVRCAIVEENVKLLRQTDMNIECGLISIA